MRPIAQRANDDGPMDELDDDWIICSVADEGATLSNTRTSHLLLLPYDQIREFMADPRRDVGDVKHGFLRLKVQVTITPRGVTVEPLWSE